MVFAIRRWSFNGHLSLQNDGLQTLKFARSFLARSFMTSKSRACFARATMGDSVSTMASQSQVHPRAHSRASSSKSVMGASTPLNGRHSEQATTGNYSFHRNPFPVIDHRCSPTVVVNRVDGSSAQWEPAHPGPGGVGIHNPVVHQCRPVAICLPLRSPDSLFEVVVVEGLVSLAAHTGRIRGSRSAVAIRAASRKAADVTQSA